MMMATAILPAFASLMLSGGVFGHVALSRSFEED